MLFIFALIRALQSTPKRDTVEVGDTEDEFPYVGDAEDEFPCVGDTDRGDVDMFNLPVPLETPAASIFELSRHSLNFTRNNNSNLAVSPPLPQPIDEEILDVFFEQPASHSPQQNSPNIAAPNPINLGEIKEDSDEILDQKLNRPRRNRQLPKRFEVFVIEAKTLGRYN